MRVTRLSVEQLSEVFLPWLPQELARVCGDWGDELDRQLVIDRLAQYVNYIP